MSPSSPWLTVPQASVYTGIPESTLRKYIRTGLLPRSKPGGKPKSRVYVARASLDALMAPAPTDTQNPS